MSDPTSRPSTPSATTSERGSLRVGDRVLFERAGNGRGRTWRVRRVSADGRFAILTKPYPLHRTVLYTIVDFDRGVRGPDNIVGGGGYETDEQLDEAIAALATGAREVSHRSSRYALLDIAEVRR